MAVRFDSSTDQLSRTATLPAINSFSMLAWCYSLAVVSGSVLAIGAADTVTFYSVGRDFSTSRVRVYAGGTLVNGTAAFPGSTWLHLALTCAGSGIGQLLAYANGVLDVTTNGSASATNAKAYLATDDAGNTMDCRLAAVKIYSAVLTADEIKQEMRCYMPVRTANLHSWLPLLAHTDTANYAGTGAWTVGGTLTTEAGPPIAWSLRPVMPQRATAVVAGTILPTMMQHAA